VKGFGERENVKRRVVEYLGLYPNSITMNAGAETAANVYSMILQMPSQIEVP